MGLKKTTMAVWLKSNKIHSLFRVEHFELGKGHDEYSRRGRYLCILSSKEVWLWDKQISGWSLGRGKGKVSSFKPKQCLFVF